MRTWIRQEQIEWLEDALTELGDDAVAVHYAAVKYRKEQETTDSKVSLETAREEYLATLRD